MSVVHYAKNVLYGADGLSAAVPERMLGSDGQFAPLMPCQLCACLRVFRNNYHSLQMHCCFLISNICACVFLALSKGSVQPSRFRIGWRVIRTRTMIPSYRSRNDAWLYNKPTRTAWSVIRFLQTKALPNMVKVVVAGGSGSMNIPTTSISVLSNYSTDVAREVIDKIIAKQKHDIVVFTQRVVEPIAL